MLEIRKNVISYNIKDYVHLIMGEKKVGKSTLFAEIGRKEYGIDKTLSISMGDEDGHKVLKDLPFVNPRTWEDFDEFVKDLVSYPDKYPYEIVSIDTIDVMVDLAIERVLKEHLIINKVPCKSINDALGGYGRGKEAVCRLITQEIELIKQSKYGLFLIGHNKVKSLEDKNGVKYLQLTSNLEEQYYNTFANKAPIVCNIDVEKQVGEALLDDSKKVRRAGNLEESERYMYFRSDGYVDAGSRFKNIPNKVPFTNDNVQAAINYINAVKEGIKDADEFTGTEEDYINKLNDDYSIKEKNANKNAEQNVKMFEQDKRDSLFIDFKKLLKTAATDQRKKVFDLIKEWGHDVDDIASNSSIEELEELNSILKENNFGVNDLS